MRKIKSKYEEKKRQKRNNYIVGAILIVVLFGSVFGILVNSFGKNNSNTNNIEYNGVVFTNQDDLWHASIGNFSFAFKNNPLELNYTGIPNVKHLENYQNKPLYVYSENYDSRGEIYRNMENIVERMQPACINNASCDGDYPIKTCSDNFIIIKENNETTNITQEDNCVYISGSNEELVNLTDEFLFRMIGIK